MTFRANEDGNPKLAGDIKKTLLSRFKKDKKGNYIVEPFDKPDFSVNGVKKLNSGIEGLLDAYVKGGSPNLFFDLNVDYGLTNPGKVQLNKATIENNYQLASVLFHEYRHAFQYFQPYMGYGSRYEAWTALYGAGYGGNGGVWSMLELDAYAEQYRMGADQYWVRERLDNYYKDMQNFWKK